MAQYLLAEMEQVVAIKLHWSRVFNSRIFGRYELVAYDPSPLCDKV